MPKEDWLKLGILYDSNSLYSPSNQQAIDKFCEYSTKYKLNPVILSKDDEINFDEYKGIFIRDTTHISSHTYEWVIKAEYHFKKVIDSTFAIERGCNKIWQVQKFNAFKIDHPKSYIVSYENSLANIITYPCIVKIPDSSFSRGVFKCNSEEEYMNILYRFNNEYIWNSGYIKKFVCQEYIESSFDWRIGIFNHKFLYAVKYYMAPDDFKVIKYDRQGNLVEGNHECVAFENVPPCVLAAAVKCDKLLDESLYGIDIKEVNGKAYVIEINDNPSIDAGVEDEIEGDKIYEEIIRWYVE